MGGTILIAAICLLCGLLTALICAYASGIGRLTGLLDRPDGGRKLHASDTPLIGGLAVLLPVFTLTLCYFGLIGTEPFIASAAVASAVVLAVGVIDDRRGLSVYVRFGLLLIVVLTVFMTEPLFILHALRLNTLDLDIGLGLFAIPVTLVIVIGFVNAVNMADGINGQLLGSVIIWSLFLIAYCDPDVRMPFYALVVSGAVALAFNMKGRLFCGSAGSYAFPLFIGLSAIALYRHRGGALNAELPALWFWLPVADCLRLFAVRLRQGRSPFSADRNHFHHVLVDLFGPRMALVAYLLLLAAPGATAIVNERLAMPALAMCLLSFAVLTAAGHKRVRKLAAGEM